MPTRPAVVKTPPTRPVVTRPVITQPVYVRPITGTLRTVAAAPRAGRFYIILDASGSMNVKMDGTPKFEIAREAVTSIVKDMSPSTFVALRVFGHRKRGIDPGGMDDTALEVPMGRLDRAQLLAKVQSLKAVGRTPLALSMSEAAQDLAKDRQPVTVILLTDGMEDTDPPRDPLAAADRLAALKHVTVHVVGFDIGREDWRKQLQAITDRAGGHYWPAPKAQELKRELRALLLDAPAEFTLIDAAGRTVGRGRFGESRTLPAGTYRLRALQGRTAFEQAFVITDRGTTTLAFADLAEVQAPW